MQNWHCKGQAGKLYLKSKALHIMKIISSRTTGVLHPLPNAGAVGQYFIPSYSMKRLKQAWEHIGGSPGTEIVAPATADVIARPARGD